MTFNVFAILMFNIFNYIIIIYLLWWLYIFVPLFFVYPFIRWWTWVHQLGCFHLLTIVHNAPMNMSTQICLSLSAFNSFGYYPEGELLDHIVILFLIFWGTTILFSIVAGPFDILTISAQGFQFFHIFTNTCYFLFFFFLFIAAVRESQLLRAELFLFKVFSQENPDLWATQISVLGNLSSVPTEIPQLENHQWKPEAVLTFWCWMGIHSTDVYYKCNSDRAWAHGGTWDPSSGWLFPWLHCKEFHGDILFPCTMRTGPRINLLAGSFWHPSLFSSLLPSAFHSTLSCLILWTL